ncbi:MAG: DUF2786 domain-containing protein [Dactylosporangium sp.]|nr:DUF2786 domain-containing protein [Dactylosporangium sp.]
MFAWPGATTVPGPGVVVDAIAAQLRTYAPTTIDERWEAQLRDLGAVVWWSTDDAYLAALGEREGLARPELIRCVLEVLHVFSTCPEIEILCPPPGQGRRGSLGPGAAGARATDPRQLDRVRALLAKAESTSFPEEAEAYTAKAQELMARHRIDCALWKRRPARTGAVRSGPSPSDMPRCSDFLPMWTPLSCCSPRCWCRRPGRWCRRPGRRPSRPLGISPVGPRPTGCCRCSPTGTRRSARWPTNSFPTSPVNRCRSPTGTGGPRGGPPRTTLG